MTGGAKRIGRCIALALARRGWDVAVHYRQSAREADETVAEVKALGRHGASVQCDLADPDAVRLLLARSLDAMGHGPIRCVVNNASLFDYDSVQTFSHSRLDAHMRTNLSAPVLLAHALYELTEPEAQAVVVNLLDQKLFNPNPDFLSYTLSKAALQAATTLLAQALAPTVRVVGVAPGITLVSGDQTDEGFARAHRQTPLGRSSTTEDVAQAVCFAAESAAMTGTTLLVDGGQHLMPLSRDVMFVVK